MQEDGAALPPTPKRKVADMLPSPLSSAPLGQALVGRHVEVYWPQDNTYYEGLVASFNVRNKRPYKVRGRNLDVEQQLVLRFRT